MRKGVIIVLERLDDDYKKHIIDYYKKTIPFNLVTEGNIVDSLHWKRRIFDTLRTYPDFTRYSTIDYASIQN